MATDTRTLQAQLMGAFFEESFEGLELLETGLLAIASQGGGAVDPTLINEIFRAAHSIKGAAGTFGLGSITELAHEMETLLEQLRSGRRLADAPTASLLLEGVDALRSMLEQLRDKGTADASVFADLRARLHGASASVASLPAPAPVLAPEAAPPRAAEGWYVELVPGPHLLQSGNDPIRLLRELEGLGPLAIEADLTRLPSLTELDPEVCYLSWRLRVGGAVAESAIRDVFAWVEDECTLVLRAEAAGQGPPAQAERAAPAAAPPAQAAAPAPVDAAAPAPGTLGAAAGAPGGKEEVAIGSVRVAVEKIDFLMNMVGELVITQSMLGELDDDGPLDAERVARLREGLGQLARNTRTLQESVMRLRSMPVSVVFNRFPRLVHDLSRQLGKKVELRLAGQSTEIDKTVLERLGDPLVHLIRNSLDHGLEGPDERLAAGKSDTGTIEMSAVHRGGDMVVEVVDDGRGLNLDRILARAKERGIVSHSATLDEAAIIDLIFAPGFSTAASVTDVSGRGVGMDVVRRNVRGIGGEIRVTTTRGKGTRTVLRLPLTLAIVDGQLVRVGRHPYVVPLLSIVESVQVQGALVKRNVGGQRLYRLRDELVPMFELGELLGANGGGEPPGLHGRLLVVVEAEGRKLGLLVDELQGQQQVVVKTLEANYQPVPGLAGATILGDGNVAFILDTAGLAQLAAASSGRRAA